MIDNKRQLYYSNNSTEKYYKQSVELILHDVKNLMSSCYGPYGSHLLIDHNIKPEATKDGKAILSSITTNGSISSAVLKTIINVANKQVSEVGDGSTTTILLLCEFYNRFNKLIAEENISPSIMNKSIKNTVDYILRYYKSKLYITDIVDGDNINWDLLYDTINISADGDVDLSKKILEMFKELNTTDPLILIELSQSDNHHYDTVKGVEESGTVIRPDVYFNGFSRMEYDSPYIVCIDGRMDLSTDIYFELCRYCLEHDINIIFMGTGMNPDTMNTVVSMSESGGAIFTRCPVFQLSLSASNESFLDMCASLGAKPVSEGMLKNSYSVENALSMIKKNAGKCDKALLTEVSARFNNPTADEKAVKQRLDIINAKIEALKNDDIVGNDSMMELNERRAFMNKHYAKFYVGGYSPQRKSINFELADDAIKQAISCMKHGIVPGCNLIIPKVISSEWDNITSDLTYIETKILDVIYESYIATYTILVKNMDMSYTYEKAMEDIVKSNYTPSNMRDDDIDVYNSSETDMVILKNASDMAALLSTAKGYISMKNEFDVVNKGYIEV